MDVYEYMTSMQGGSYKRKSDFNIRGDESTFDIKSKGVDVSFLYEYSDFNLLTRSKDKCGPRGLTVKAIQELINSTL